MIITYNAGLFTTLMMKKEKNAKEQKKTRFAQAHTIFQATKTQNPTYQPEYLINLTLFLLQHYGRDKIYLQLSVAKFSSTTFYVSESQCTSTKKTVG
jgi:hypothetical protein